MSAFYDDLGHEIGSVNTFVKITVAGVTYKNGRRNRQTILRQIYWKDTPYNRIDPEDCIDLVPTEYEGSPAVEVWVRNKKAREQIGYIPKEEATFFYDNMYRYDGHFDFEVYGGGITSEGKRLNYGASFTARFKNTGNEFPASSPSPESPVVSSPIVPVLFDSSSKSNQPPEPPKPSPTFPKESAAPSPLPQKSKNYFSKILIFLIFLLLIILFYRVKTTG